MVVGVVRSSLIRARIRATASIKLISCQVRVELSMLASLTDLSENLLAGKVEQLVGGNRRDGLLGVAHSVKPSAVKPGPAEPSDGVVFGGLFI